MNPFFILLIFWLFLVRFPGQVQAQMRPQTSDIWAGNLTSQLLASQSGAGLLEFWQVNGITNLNAFRFSHFQVVNRSSLIGSYQLYSMPGFRSHELAVALILSPMKGMRWGQELGFRLLESGFGQTGQWQIENRSFLLIESSGNWGLRFVLRDWPDLFFPESDHLAPAGMGLVVSQQITEQVTWGFGFETEAGSASQAILIAQMDLWARHALFIGIRMVPLAFSLGYAICTPRLQIRFLLESGSSFGLSPYSALSWTR